VVARNKRGHSPVFTSSAPTMPNIPAGVMMKLEGNSNFSQMFLKYVDLVIDNDLARREQPRS
jgi:hypothetical protein